MIKDYLWIVYDDDSIIILAGQKKFVPRKRIWFSDHQTLYRFSGSEMNVEEGPALLNDIRILLNNILKKKYPSV